MSVRALVFVTLSLLGVARASAQTETTSAPEERPPIDRVVFELAPGEPAHKSMIVAYAGNEERLRLAVSGGPRTPVPKLVDGSIVACAGAQLYFVDTVPPRVRRRVPLPGECSALFLENGAATVRVTGGESTPWTRYIEIREDAPPVLPFPRASLLFEQHQIAQIAPGATLRTHAQRLAEMRKPGNALALAQADAELARREALDITNPWYSFERAMIAEARGDERAFRAHLGHVFERDRAYDLELMRMVTALDRTDPALAERAFARGYAYLVSHGYVPALATSGLLAVVLLGTPDGAPLDVSEHYDVLARHARRLARLEPHAEGSAGLFEALREEAARRGEDADEAFFAGRTAPSARNRGYGVAAWEAALAGDLVNVMLGLFFALFVLTAFKIARTFGKAPEDAFALHRMSPLARFTRAERFSVIVAVLLFWTAGTFAARGIALMGQYAAAPIGLGMGMLGDPETVAYTREMTGSPGGDLLHAIALLGAGERTRAKPFLERSALPEARRLLTQLTGPGIPAASPELDALDEAHRTRLGRKGTGAATSPLLAPLAVFAIASGEGEVIDLNIIVSVVLLILLLALLGPYRGETWPAPARPAAYTAALFVPGAPRAYGVLSYVVGGAVVTTILAVVMLSASDGMATNVLDAIAVPDVSRFYGATGKVTPDRRVLFFYGPGVVAVAAHLVYVGFFARRSEDPARGLAAASSETAAESSPASSEP